MAENVGKVSTNAGVVPPQVPVFWGLRRGQNDLLPGSPVAGGAQVVNLRSDANRRAARGDR